MMDIETDTLPCFCGEQAFSTRKRLPINPSLTSRGLFHVEIVECSACGLMRTSPTPVMSEDSAYYDREDVPKSHIENQELWRGFSREVLEEVRLFKTGGTLLDVGCNIGILVDEARKMGFEAEGIDLSEAAVEFGCKSFEVPLKRQFLQALPGAGLYDVIVMNHTLEHIHDLRDLLKHVARLLKKDGVFVSFCPNAAGGIPRVLNVLNHRKSGRGSQWYWYGYLPEQHVWQFSPASLRRVFEACDFEVLRVDATQNMHWGATANPGLRFRLMKLLWGSFAAVGLGDNLMIAGRPRAGVTGRA